MPNDLATLNGLLDIQIRDPSDQTWTSAEKDQLITQAIAELWNYGILTFLAPASYTQALTTSTYTYTLNSAIRALSRVDLVDTNSDERGPLQPGTWEVWGDISKGSGIIHVSPTIVDSIGGTLRYHGYGVYDLTANYIPDRFVSAVLAHARAEAYRRVSADRVRFKQLQRAGPLSNTSINELLGFIAEAESEKASVYSRARTLRKPVPARVG